jgi:hypothetical protein
MTLEFIFDPKVVMERLAGRVEDVKSGNAKFGKASNFRIEGDKCICDADLNVGLWENYGAKGRIDGFPVKAR